MLMPGGRFRIRRSGNPCLSSYLEKVPAMQPISKPSVFFGSDPFPASAVNYVGTLLSSSITYPWKQNSSVLCRCQNHFRFVFAMFSLAQPPSIKSLYQEWYFKVRGSSTIAGFLMPDLFAAFPNSTSRSVSLAFEIVIIQASPHRCFWFPCKSILKQSSFLLAQRKFL